jgi:hypothetical protein
MTLVEFLEARLAEDELMATAAIEDSAEWHAFYAYRDVRDADGHFVVLGDRQYPTVAQAAHIARHSPARVLAQCEAGRAMIAEFLRLDAFGDTSGRRIAENALRQLASVHSEHSDFDTGWL